MSDCDRTLVVAPYVGEFGWELMNWQARIRRLVERASYSRVIVVATEDRRGLYEFASHFQPCAAPDMQGHANEDHRVDESGKRIAPEELTARLRTFLMDACRNVVNDWTNIEILTPPFDSTIWPTTRRHQRFVELRKQGRIESDIVLIPRGRALADERNQPTSWWDDLAAHLRTKGLIVESYPHGVDAAIQTLSRTRLAIGASTGGLHLASLCRCPHYVWGCGAEARWTKLGMTNRQRYETVWNPLGTPCIYDECGWRPSIEHVARRTIEALDSIGLRDDGRESTARQGAAWYVRRGLSRLMQPDFATAMPWRLRRLIVERMI